MSANTDHTEKALRLILGEGDPHFKSDAREVGASALLVAAARLVERALAKLDTKETPCTHCANRLFHNSVQARLFERLAETPQKLRNAAKFLGPISCGLVARNPGRQRSL